MKSEMIERQTDKLFLSSLKYPLNRLVGTEIGYSILWEEEKLQRRHSPFA